MNSHCLYDCRGTPGDENERQCHPYGILITIGDATKPQNMSTQTSFKHSPFNGRGGFWRTSALKQVGFDHRTVGEDHDAGYRGLHYNLALPLPAAILVCAGLLFIAINGFDFLCRILTTRYRPRLMFLIYYG